MRQIDWVTQEPPAAPLHRISRQRVGASTLPVLEALEIAHLGGAKGEQLQITLAFTGEAWHWGIDLQIGTRCMAWLPHAGSVWSAETKEQAIRNAACQCLYYVQQWMTEKKPPADNFYQRLLRAFNDTDAFSIASAEPWPIEAEEDACSPT